MLLGDSSGLPGQGRKTPERRGAGGIGHEMDALLIGRILDPVQAPAVEEPGIARRHVHLVTAAMKYHLGPRNHRDMDPYPVIPVVVDVRVFDYLRAGSQAHQARTAPDYREARQYLPYIGQALQRRSRLHQAVHIIVFAAIDADKAQRRVAWRATGVRRPG